MTITVAGNKKEYEDGLKLTELIEKEEIRQIQDVPLKVSFLKNEIVPINLKLEEALFVINLLKELGPLNGCELIAEKIIQKVEEAV